MSNNIILAPRWTSTALQLANTAYIDCGTPTVLSNLTSFTLEVWVNPASLSGFQALVGNVDNNGPELVARADPIPPQTLF